MPKVGAHLGLTFKLKKDSNYEFMRPDISIDDIDVDGDVDAQLEKCKEALRKTFGITEEMVYELIIQQKPDMDIEYQLKVSTRLQDMTNMIKALEKRVLATEKKAA